MILRAIASVVFILCASHANAQTCPDFYRFVDFGTEANDCVTYRGGLVLRAEGFDGSELLLTDQTKCTSVPEVAKDGHGNPIPVVQSINYKPQVTSIDLEELRVSKTNDTQALAEENASLHQSRIKKPDVNLTRGSDFLCVRLENEFSCQQFSPYPGNIPLVIYCDKDQCRMPILAINEKIMASASWKFEEALLETPASANAKITKKVQQIHDFLKPLSADL